MEEGVIGEVKYATGAFLKDQSVYFNPTEGFSKLVRAHSPFIEPIDPQYTLQLPSRIQLPRVRFRVRVRHHYLSSI